MANQKQFANHLCNLEELANTPQLPSLCAAGREQPNCPDEGVCGEGTSAPPALLARSQPPWRKAAHTLVRACVDAQRKMILLTRIRRTPARLMLRVKQVPNWSWFTRQGRADALVVATNFSCDFPPLVRICLFCRASLCEIKEKWWQTLFFSFLPLPEAPRHSC